MDDPWTIGAQARCEVRQIESSVDLPRQMIFEDRIAKMKLVG